MLTYADVSCRPVCDDKSSHTRYSLADYERDPALWQTRTPWNTAHVQSTAERLIGLRYSIDLLSFVQRVQSTNTDANRPQPCLWRPDCLGFHQHLLRYSIYLLYWYKSTNTDRASAQTRAGSCRL